jgi:hypothetical protein
LPEIKNDDDDDDDDDDDVLFSHIFLPRRMLPVDRVYTLNWK